MKKISLLIILIFILCLISSCNSNRENIILKERDLKVISSKMESKSNIVFLNNEKLYYFTDIVNKETPDLANETLYEYNFNDKNTKKINTFTNIAVSSGSKALYNNSVYIPLATNIENTLYKIDTKSRSLEVIKKWITFPPLAYVYTVDDNLILFGPKTSDGITIEYYINKIDLNSNNEKNIITKKMKNKKGETISCIDVDKEFIYAFSISATGDKEIYNIIQYDLNGKQSNVYPFDLKAFLDPTATLTGEDDAISKLYKEKDYFILNTLNGRVFIFKMVNNKLIPIKIPEKFYKNNPSGFHFIEYYDGKSEVAYFTNLSEENNIITIFNYSTEKFTTLELPNDIENQYNFDRNARGDLIVKKVNKKDISKVEYYYINFKSIGF